MYSIYTFVIVSMCVVSTVLAGGQSSEWVHRTHPYRLHVDLASTHQGKVQLNIDPEVIIREARRVSVDVTDYDTFAFERAVLVDPVTGEAVGRFVLVPSGEPVPIDGQFTLLESGASSPWDHFGPKDGIAFESREANDGPERAIWIRSDKIVNRGLNQPLALTPNRLYLLKYYIFSDPIDNNIGISIVDPDKRLFVDEDHSYYNKLTPRAQWTLQQVLYRPAKQDVNLRIGAAFTGTGGLGDLVLQPVELRLVADLPNPTDRLDLYVVMRGGHRLPQPMEDVIASAPQSQAIPVAATVAGAEAANLNEGSALVEADGMRAWTIAGHLPLKASVISDTAPDGAASQAVVRESLARGTSRSLLIAVQTDTPYASLQVDCELPLASRVERLAEIPVYDDAYPYGQLVEHRLDALVPVDYPLIPPSTSGIHLLSVTVHATEDATPGVVQGRIKVQVQSQEPREQTLVLPVEIAVLPPVVKPMRHFGTMFAGQHFTVRYFGGSGPFTHDSTTVAEFHGYTARNLEPSTAVSLTSPEHHDDRLSAIRSLARKYYHRMLDYALVPQTMAIYSPYTYKVRERDDRQIPELTDWDFTAYDEAIDEFVIARDVPWLAIYHSNGHLMDRMRLANGKTYSFKPNAKDPNWNQISKEDYYTLVGDYFEVLAAHLGQKGVLDRAMYVIDESDPSTYEVIRDYVHAIKAREHGRKIKFGHTAYKTSLWTRRMESGELMLADVLDVPMPDNDELFSFFEPEWNARLNPSDDKEQWVYYVESDHLNLLWAGMSTIVTPLKLKQFGAEGWYIWASFIWSMPYPKTEVVGPKFPSGPVVNPWLNPFYHHGPGVLSFFYPPDPRGPAAEPTDLIIPSHRLALMRDGIQLRSLLEVAERGVDDAGRAFHVDREKLAEAKAQFSVLWAQNPVQWYLSYPAYQRARQLLVEACLPADHDTMP